MRGILYCITDTTQNVATKPTKRGGHNNPEPRAHHSRGGNAQVRSKPTATSHDTQSCRRAALPPRLHLASLTPSVPESFTAANVLFHITIGVLFKSTTRMDSNTNGDRSEVELSANLK